LLGSGLMAGLYFAYSNSVMPALARLPGPQGIAAMNHINVVILNPLFLTIFMGTAVLALMLIVAALLGWTAKPAWIVAGRGALSRRQHRDHHGHQRADEQCARRRRADGPNSAMLWANHLDRWVFWNHVRAIACTASLAAFALALL
jgi:uncharacterized membrane protein